MNLSSISTTQLQLAKLGQTSSSGSATQSSSQILGPANERLTQSLSATNVKLSAYGTLKSAFGTSQSAASSLSSAAASKTASSSDVSKAAQAFVDAYNQAEKAVGTSTATGSKPGALTADFHAGRAGRDLAQALTSGSGAADLKQVGITQNKDGSLSLDTKALDQALQANSTQTKSALGRLGQQVSDTAGRELASTGNVGASLGSLTSKAQTLTAQQHALQQQAATAQSAIDNQSAVLNYFSLSGIAAYQRFG